VVVTSHVASNGADTQSDTYPAIIIASVASTYRNGAPRLGTDAAIAVPITSGRTPAANGPPQRTRNPNADNAITDKRAGSSNRAVMLAAVSVAGMYSGATGATTSLYQSTVATGIARPTPHHAMSRGRRLASTAHTRASEAPATSTSPSFFVQAARPPNKPAARSADAADTEVVPRT
jgi:hypothetical protein